MKIQGREKWWRMLSPAVIGSVCIGVIILNGLAALNQSQGWSLIVVMIFLPALLVLVLTSLALRFFFRFSTKKLWVAELAVLLLMTLVYALFIF